eukprot:3941216-Rhodomonas_salina.4
MRVGLRTRQAPGRLVPAKGYRTQPCTRRRSGNARLRRTWRWQCMLGFGTQAPGLAVGSRVTGSGFGAQVPGIRRCDADLRPQAPSFRTQGQDFVFAAAIQLLEYRSEAADFRFEGWVSGLEFGVSGRRSEISGMGLGIWGFRAPF